MNLSIVDRSKPSDLPLYRLVLINIDDGIMGCLGAGFR